MGSRLVLLLLLTLTTSKLLLCSFFRLFSLRYHQFIHGEQNSLSLSLSVLTEAHSLTNAGNSRLIAPPLPQFTSYSLSSLLLSPFDFLSVFTETIFHADPSHSFFSLPPSSPRLRHKISKFRQTQHSSFSLFSHFFRVFFSLRVKDKKSCNRKMQNSDESERRKDGFSLFFLKSTNKLKFVFLQLKVVLVVLKVDFFFPHNAAEAPSDLDVEAEKFLCRRNSSRRRKRGRGGGGEERERTSLSLW